MRFWFIWCFWIAARLYGQSLNVSTGTAVYHIDSSSRGQDIVNMIATLSNPPFTTGAYANSGIAVQTRMTGSNGGPLLIDYVVGENVWPTTNATILIIASQSAKGNNSNLTFYVVPVEDIVEVIYSAYSPVNSSDVYSVTATTGILPLYEVNMAERAADIIDVFSIIRANPIYFRYQSQSYFTLQTTLNGPYPLPLTNGIVPYVQCVGLTPSSLCSTSGIPSYSSNSTLLYITYNSSNTPSQASYLIAGTDQVYGITYYPNP